MSLKTIEYASDVIPSDNPIALGSRVTVTEWRVPKEFSNPAKVVDRWIYVDEESAWGFAHYKYVVEFTDAYNVVARIIVKDRDLDVLDPLIDES
jgi:hypothetical protein